VYLQSFFLSTTTVMGALLHINPASAMNLEPLCTLQFNLIYFMVESQNATLQLITKPCPFWEISQHIVELLPWSVNKSSSKQSNSYKLHFLLLLILLIGPGFVSCDKSEIVLSKIHSPYNFACTHYISWWCKGNFTKCMEIFVAPVLITFPVYIGL